ILSGAIFMNIPVAFFSLKFVLFSIGVPIAKSSKLLISDKYIAYIGIKKLNNDILFFLQYFFNFSTCVFSILNCFLLPITLCRLFSSFLLPGIVATSGIVWYFSSQYFLSF